MRLHDSPFVEADDDDVDQLEELGTDISCVPAHLSRAIQSLHPDLDPARRHGLADTGEECREGTLFHSLILQHAHIGGKRAPSRERRRGVGLEPARSSVVRRVKVRSSGFISMD